MEFEWDPHKAFFNLWKHDVSFDDAKGVFGDALGLSIPDEPHSEGEERFLRIGMSRNERLLVVAYTIRSEKVRIISCREATPSERRRYEGHEK